MKGSLPKNPSKLSSTWPYKLEARISDPYDLRKQSSENRQNLAPLSLGEFHGRGYSLVSVPPSRTKQFQTSRVAIHGEFSKQHVGFVYLVHEVTTCKQGISLN